MVPRHPPPTHHPPTTHTPTHQPPTHPLAQPQHTHSPPIHPSTTHPPTRYHPHTTHHPPTHVWCGMLYMYGYVRLSALRWLCLGAAHSGIFGAAPCAGSSSAHMPPPAPPRQEPAHPITNQLTTHLANQNTPTAHPYTHSPHPPSHYHPHSTHHPPTNVWFVMFHMHRDVRLSAVRWFCGSATRSGVGQSPRTTNDYERYGLIYAITSVNAKRSRENGGVGSISTRITSFTTYLLSSLTTSRCEPHACS
jgi:hypothetical protein